MTLAAALFRGLDLLEPVLQQTHHAALEVDRLNAVEARLLRIVFGSLIILILIKEPDGLASLIGRRARRATTWPRKGRPEGIVP